MASEPPMRIAIFGLGEAGSLIASDLARSGADVHAYDPAPVVTPDQVIRHDEPREAVSEAALVLGITAAVDASTAMSQAWDEIAAPTLYADLATAPPGVERELSVRAAKSGVLFADVALMAPVPGNGLATPALASGSGAEAFAGLLNPLGGRVEVIGPEAGDASARKLLRSVVTKGLAGLIIESMEAAASRDDSDWMWSHLVEQLTAIDEAFLRRLIEGTSRHVTRRLDEVAAVEAMLEDLDVSSHMTRGTLERLREVAAVGLPVSLTPPNGRRPERGG